MKKLVLLSLVILMVAGELSAQFHDGRREDQSREGFRRGKRDMGTFRRLEPGGINHPIDFNGNKLAAWIQNIISQASAIQYESQQVELSQADLAIAMQKLAQAQQLLIDVNNLMTSMVPAGVCAMMYEGPNYSGASYEIYRTDGDFQSQYMYSNFTSFPIFTGNSDFPTRVNINDQISSVAVARGCTLILSQHKNYGGTNHTYTNNTPMVHTDNDATAAKCYCR